MLRLIATHSPSSAPCPSTIAATRGRGRWVFAERFLLRRGEHCESGCRHSPYRRPIPPPT
ncbi:MAG: DUF5522 domain-containing protein [Tepidisphaeraceae bacterium]